MIAQPETRSRMGWLAVGLVLAAAVVVLYALAILLGDLNQDEGWYLYAGRLVAEGKLPFRDFASTQGPVMAYVYALATPFVQLGGLAGGRVFTALLGLATLLATGRLTWRIAVGTAFPVRDHALRETALLASLLAVAMLGLNLYHVYFTSLVKTYGLAGLLLMGGLLGLELSLQAADGGEREAGRRAFGFGSLAALLLALAAGTRLSGAVLLPVLWLVLALQWYRRGGGSGGLMSLAGMLAGGVAGMVLVFGPYLLMAPESMRFGLLEYHAGRHVGGMFSLLAYKAGFVLRLTGAYFPLAVLAAIGLLTRAGGGRPARAVGLHRELPLLLGAGAAAVTLVHLAAPFPYDDYQVFVMPCVAVLVALPLARRLIKLGTVGRRIAAFVTVMILLLAHSSASPLLQSWMLAERDRIWWPLKTETPLHRLRQAAAAVRELRGEAGPPVLLTQDTYLAVEAGLRVPPGMELGPFCYFPGLNDEQAILYHVMNASRLQEVLATSPAEVAAFSGYGLAIRAPAIAPLAAREEAQLVSILEQGYREVLRIPEFGQASTTLRLLKRKGHE